ncbi:MAG: acetate--CoA ligase [Geminicoccaceae bacterium]|nr:MAG: acetate--CoA ligase [Geminicoccaceae bacterium]
MTSEAITKSAADLRCRPNLDDPGTAARLFTWATARARFPALAGGRFNMAIEAVDRQVEAGRGAEIALRFVAADDRVSELTYGELARRTHAFARTLGSLQVNSGATVASWLPAEPAYAQALLGTLEAGAVFCPLDPRSSPETLAARLAVAEARVLVTTRARYRDVVRHVQNRLPSLQWILLSDGRAEDEGGLVRALPARLQAAPTTAPDVVTGGQDVALLHFTRGTMGRAKAVLHVHEALVAHVWTARAALDLHPDDVFCCTLDPTSALGLAYGFLAPLTLGVVSIIDEVGAVASAGSGGRLYALLQNQRVTVLLTNPEVIDRLRSTDWRLPQHYDLRRMRFIVSVGGGLPPSAIAWSQAFLGTPIHNQWGQAETGAILLANLAATPVQPGCLGRPLPGVEAAIVRRTERGVEPLGAQAVEGELALRCGWPSMYRGFRGDPGRAEACLVDGWYLTGDRFRRDAAGDFWFVGRCPPGVKAPSVEPPTDRSPVPA